MNIKRLRDLREDNDKYQKEIAYILNVSQQYYSEYEKGNRPIPVDKLIKLALFYNTSIDYICGLTNQKEPYPRKHSIKVFFQYNQKPYLYVLVYLS